MRRFASCGENKTQNKRQSSSIHRHSNHSHQLVTQQLSCTTISAPSSLVHSTASPKDFSRSTQDNLSTTQGWVVATTKLLGAYAACLHSTAITFARATLRAYLEACNLRRDCGFAISFSMNLSRFLKWLKRIERPLFLSI